MKLSHKFIIVTIPCILIIALVIAFLIYSFTRSSLEKEISAQQVALASQTMDKVDRFLHEKFNNIQSISEDEEFEGFLSGKDSDNPKEIAESETKLRELLLTTGPWDGLSLTDISGKIILSINKEELGQNIQEHYPDVLATTLAGEAYHSDVFFDEELKRPTMLFAAPIRNEENPKKPVVGLVVGHLSWGSVLEILQNTNYVIELFNKQAVEIGDNHPENTSEILKKKASTNRAIQNALTGKSGSEVLTAVDQEGEVLTSYVPEKGFLNYTGNGWVLLIEAPTTVIFANARENAFVLSLLICAMLFGVIVFVILLFEKIAVQPIVNLTHTTKQIAEGDLSKRVQVTSHDEIGQLGIAFNNMADQLQELYAGLERKVQEKTSLLAQKVIEVGQEKAKDEALLANLAEGMIATDAQGRIIKINTVAKEILELDESSKTRELYECVTLFNKEAIIPKEQNPIYLALQNGKFIEGTYEIHTKAKNRTLGILANPLKQGETVIGAIILIRDVTKEKEIDRMKTEFISLASHQLRTPLSAIKWFSEMLLNGDAGQLTDEQKDFAKNIDDSTERMIDLVNSLLNISRIESGRIVVDPKPTDLKELVEGIVKELQVKLSQKEQTLIVSVHQDMPQINLDPKLIRQVYMNLLTNAIKYTPKGGEISVFISRKDADVISQVTDNGYGIPKAEQPKLFQKFFRAENIIKVETDGTGLGLYLIKAIIESSHGKIWVESEENKGTTFWFSLPMAGMEAKKGEVTLDE